MVSVQITHVQELIPAGFSKRKNFVLQFLMPMEVDAAWLYNILLTDETHFNLQNEINAQHCRLWAKENPNIS